MVTGNVDSLLTTPSIDKFAAVGDYGTGAVFVVVPDEALYERMLVAARGRRFLYGEQDFLNHFFRRDSDGREARQG